jgi:hypothetical protein
MNDPATVGHLVFVWILAVIYLGTENVSKNQLKFQALVLTVEVNRMNDSQVEDDSV